MPVSVSYDDKGDLLQADMLRDYALAQRLVMCDLMKFNGLKQDQRYIKMIDGSVIKMTSCFGDDKIDIYCPKKEKVRTFGYERFFALASVGVWTWNKTLISSGCTIWDLHNDKLAQVSFSLPAPYVGQTDAANWGMMHFNNIYINACDYTVNETLNTITCNLVDFTALNNYGPCVKPGDFVYHWTGRHYTRVHAVEPHVLYVGKVRNLIFNGYYPMIQVSCSIRMFQETFPGIHAMNGSGGREYSAPENYSLRPMTTGNWSFANDSFQMQTHSGYGNIVMAQNNKLDKSAQGFFTPNNYDSSPGFEAAVQDMVNYAYDAAGEMGDNQYGYTNSDMYRFNEIAGDT